MKKTFLFLILLSIFSNAQTLTPKNITLNSELMAFMQMPEIIILNSEDDSDIKIDIKIEDYTKIE